METVGLFEAKNRLSELATRAGRSQRIGITRHGKLTALIVPAEPSESVEEIFPQYRSHSQTRQTSERRKCEGSDRRGPHLNRFVLDASVGLRWFLDNPVPASLKGKDHMAFPDGPTIDRWISI